MKTIKSVKTKILSLAQKVKGLPKKYLIVGCVVGLAVLGSVGTLIWQLSSGSSPESASNQKTGQKSGAPGNADDTATTDDQPTANPDDPAASDPGATDGSASGSSNNSKPKKSGGSGSSAPASAPEPDTSKPTTPTGFTVVNGPGVSRIMDWDASSDNIGVAGYYIYRMMFPNEPPTQIIDTISDGSTDDTQGDANVDLFCNHSGSISYYAVRAFDAAGNLSDPAMASIPDEEWVNCTPIGT